MSTKPAAAHIEYLRRVSPAEAKKIERIACLALKDYYSVIKKYIFIFCEGDALKEIATDLLRELEETGIINTATIGFKIKLGKHEHNKKWLHALKFQKRLLLAESDNRSTELWVKGFLFTKIGAEINSLGNFEMNRDYLAKVIDNIKSQGFRVYEAAIIKETDDGVEVEDERTEY